MEAKSSMILETYIPIDRRQALATDKSLSVKGQGSVLFADISGFTHLTAKLANELGDQRGADEITRYLNLIYGDLINQIHLYHGSVISFAGDAISCWFENDEGKRAIAAGLGMQVAVIELIEKHKLDIQVKIVIDTGNTFRYCVGDPEIQLMDLLVGETISRLGLAEKLAQPGELLISERIVNKFKAILSLGKKYVSAAGDQFFLLNSLKEEVQPAPWPLQAQLPPEILTQWLLSEVYEKVKHGEERFLAELRLTVSLFLKFEGIDYDNDSDGGNKINQFISWVQQKLQRHDGHLLQVIIGDKGNYLYIGFGALNAHEDDPERAISTAVTLRQVPESLSFIKNIQIGITQGRMLAGPYGSRSRRTYSMLGADANLAARLMEQAEPGQILMTERVAISAQNKFLFDPIGSFRFKGIEHSVPVFSFLGLRNVNQQIQLNQTPLVGRTEELQQILRYIENVRNVEPAGIILLKSEGGTGKTRLLSEIIRQIQTKEIIILNSFGYAIENSTPYFVIRELIGQLINADKYSTVDLQEHILDLVKDINPEWELLLPLLGEILPLNYTDNELTSQMYGDIKARNLHSLLIGIFSSLTRQKACLIILDDAHWIDSASWAFIKELIYSVPKTGLIISSRPFGIDPPRDYQELIDNSPLTEILLNNFSKTDIEKLVSQVIGVSSLPDDALSLIFERTSGHPFFSEELAFALVESGILIVENDSCRLVQNLIDAGNINVPDTVQSAITSRLDRMTLSQLLSLKVSSILGRLFLFKAVHNIHPSPPEPPVLRGQMDDMTKLNLIALQVVEPELAFSFKQNIIHDVAYGMLSFDQRNELHEKAALWYESTFEANLTQHYSHLGYHWQQAGEFGKALYYYEKAAFDAGSKGAFRDGIAFIQQALSLEDKTELSAQRKALLHIEMGISYFKTGELHVSTEELKTGIRLLRKPAPSTIPGMGLNMLRQSGIQFIYRIRPRSKSNSSPLPENRKISLTLSRAYEYLGQAYFHHNKLFFSLDAGLTGLNIAEKAGPSSQLARAYGSLCVTSGTMPIPGLSEEYARLAQSLLGEETGLGDHGRILELIAVAWSGKGRWADVEDLCTTAIGMANKIGDRFLMMENTCILAACLLPQARLEESIRLREELYNIGVQDKVELVQGWALLQLAEVALKHREYQKAHDYLTAAEKVEHALGQPDKLWLHGLHAAAYTRLNNMDMAFASANKALSLARQSLPTSFFVLEGYAGMVLAFMTLQANHPENSLFRKRTRQALAAFGKYAGSFQIGKPRLHYWLGKWSLQKGNSKRAIKHWSTGLKNAEMLCMVYEAERLGAAIGKVSV